MKIVPICKAAETTEWRIESLHVDNSEWKHLTDKEFEDMAIKEAEEIFQTLYYGLPATTFTKFVERIERYKKETD